MANPRTVGLVIKTSDRGSSRSTLQSLSKVLTPWVAWGGVGSAEVADRALRLSRPDALMPSTAPGKARCAELFPPGARHLVTLGNVADRYTHPDDQPDPPETLQ